MSNAMKGKKNMMTKEKMNKIQGNMTTKSISQ